MTMKEDLAHILLNASRDTIKSTEDAAKEVYSFLNPLSNPESNITEFSTLYVGIKGAIQEFKNRNCTGLEEVVDYIIDLHNKLTPKSNNTIPPKTILFSTPPGVNWANSYINSKPPGKGNSYYKRVCIASLIAD